MADHQTLWNRRDPPAGGIILGRAISRGVRSGRGKNRARVSPGDAGEEDEATESQRPDPPRQRFVFFFVVHLSGHLPLAPATRLENREHRLMQSLVKGGAALLQAYYRHVPLTIGKRPMWNSVVRRLMAAGHDLDLEARTRFGARMHVRFPDTIQSYVYFFGVWEPAITAYLTQALVPGDIVIDIGANIGYDTLLASHMVGPGGRVHAIEASPHVFRLLSENLALNHTANVTPHHAAACAHACTVPVYLHDSCNLGGTTIMPAVASRRAVTLEGTVPGLPLTEIVPEADILAARLIKIDVEGAEWPVVQGFASLLPQLASYTELLIEISAEGLADHGITVPMFLELFRDAGFAPFAIGNRYTVDMYLEPAAARPEPLTNLDFDQLDVLFRRA